MGHKRHTCSLPFLDLECDLFSLCFTCSVQSPVNRPPYYSALPFSLSASHSFRFPFPPLLLFLQCTILFIIITPSLSSSVCLSNSFPSVPCFPPPSFCIPSLPQLHGVSYHSPTPDLSHLFLPSLAVSLFSLLPLMLFSSAVPLPSLPSLPCHHRAATSPPFHLFTCYLSRLPSMSPSPHPLSTWVCLPPPGLTCSTHYTPLFLSSIYMLLLLQHWKQLKGIK